jgi:hypothetical protein
VTLINLLSNVSMNSNIIPYGSSPTLWPPKGAGLLTYGGTVLQVRSCSFRNNSFGVQISPNDGNNSMTGIDLGQSDDPGRNEFSDNYPHLYLRVPYGGSGVLRAAGNTFDGYDCRSATNHELTAVNAEAGYGCNYSYGCFSDVAFEFAETGIFNNQSHWNVIVDKCGKAGW